ncbi:hypothetical protein GHT06_015660 [Daphnia sinensis]|uniref:CUB domain-containing protein n=1 Tax=Daphnia sinensis TaxID=1820382 RepID=A0AAD5PT45_9CRUS|nr:hypothetical protein GHT06_015660 [Daphnia sinensis]
MLALTLLMLGVTLPANYDFNNNLIFRDNRRQDYVLFHPYSYTLARFRRPTWTGQSQPRRHSEVEDDPGNKALTGYLDKFSSFQDRIHSNSKKMFSKMRNVNPLSSFMPCTATRGNFRFETGVCLLAPLCSFYGGRPTTGDSCRMGLTCCVNEIPSCGQLVTFNNTYWQSPNKINSESSCSLTVKLDEYFVEQRKPICQLRLDFLTFSIAQPNAETVCDVDNFRVIGATNKVPIICGENHGQHMYLMLPRSSTTVELQINLGSSTTHPVWRIKISMFPCDSEFLAPEGCLQYFTSPSGIITTFNWKDTSGRTTRQLANQDYYICFRTEMVQRQSSSQVATTLCLSQCHVANGLSFSLSGDVEETSQRAGARSCSNDYIVFPGGFSLPTSAPLNQRDRYCGTLLSQAESSTVSQTICSTAKPFRLLYRTNGDERVSRMKDTNPFLGNQGFCLNFEQKPS